MQSAMLVCHARLWSQGEGGGQARTDAEIVELLAMWCSLADQLLTNLWRWLCSPASALASPALHQAVAGLMRKCLAQVGILISSARGEGAVEGDIGANLQSSIS